MYRSAGRSLERNASAAKYSGKRMNLCAALDAGASGKGSFVTMNHAGLVFEKETLELLLPVGIYRLIAVKRLLNGDQEAAELLFAIEKEKQTELYMPDFEKNGWRDAWEKNSVLDEIQSCLLRDILLQRADGTLSSLEKLVSGKRSILAFLEIGAEPTEHVLNEFCTGKERKRKFQR